MNQRAFSNQLKTADSAAPMASRLLQRKCACGNHALAGTKCRECAKENAQIRRKQPNESEAEAPPIVHEVLSSQGQSLGLETRDFFEPRFGRDLSSVRVHTNAKAAESARAVNALAYTVGRDVVFGHGQYAPHTAAGRHLLAHEFTHTIQQSDGLRGESGLRIGHPSGTAEREAARTADAIMTGHAPDVVQRDWSLARQTPAPAPGVQPPSPPPPAQTTLAQELQALIDAATWPEIRKRVYPKESAAGVKRAKERRAGTRPDMIGLGRLKTLDHFAHAVRAIQVNWPTLSTPDKRMEEIKAAANVELVGVDVPGFRNIEKKSMDPKGFFDPADWKFVVNDALVSNSSLSDPDAGELTNTTLHESRHAEQQFLAARFSAGTNKKAAAIAKEQSIPKVIAEKAVEKKFDAKTDPAAAALGKQMYQTTVTDGDANQAISDDMLAAITELNKRSQAAQAALAALKAGQTPATTADATAKRDALKAQVSVVEQKYSLYRAIPYEADAHEVGDAAQLAFEGSP